MMDESKNAEQVANMVRPSSPPLSRSVVAGNSIIPIVHPPNPQVNVHLPLTVPPSESVNTTLRHQLLDVYNCYVAHFWHNGKWWVRCSAQIWNEVSEDRSDRGLYK